MTTASIPNPRQRRRRLDTEPPPRGSIRIIEVPEYVSEEEMAKHPLVLAFDRMIRNPLPKESTP